jgi:4-amino-4-deoxy-L-arabinose transferase-like glycosyltransferase
VAETVRRRITWETLRRVTATTTAKAAPRTEPGPRTWSPWIVGGALAVVLLAYAGRYGYHRDELYFLILGHRLDWGYVDQGPLAPLIARLADTVAPDSLVALRTASALFSAVTVVLVAAIARELGGSRQAQLLAALIAAVSSMVLAAGHLHTTATFDITTLRTGDTRLMLAAGAVAGVALLNKYLIAGFAVALLGAVLIAGPRRWLRDPWVLGGAVLALLIWLPNLLWQARNGWPQLEMAESLSTGEDTSYGGRLVFVALQFVLISPFLVPVCVAGAVALFRRPQWRPYRAIGWAWALVTVGFLLIGGKGYYTAPLLLVLAAAGSVPTVEWWNQGRAALRRGLVVAAVVLSGLVDAVLWLPILPPDGLPDAIVAVNYDAGETIGWPEFADSLARVQRSLPTEPDRAIILTANYGEAGAVVRYGPERGLPRAYSGHNSMARFGPPPNRADVVIAVGYREATLRRLFAEVEPAGRIDLNNDIDNDENGGRIWVCGAPREPWPQLWDRIRHVN